MSEFLQYLLAFVFALGILVTFHEFGHYWVARRFDVKILRFSVGFGRPLYRRLFGADNSEFVIAAIPLGGYVKMLDEREGRVPAEERERAFNRKPLGQRFAIVLAGPLFNFIFAILAYWLVFTLGVTGVKPVVDSIEQGSLAARAGLGGGQEILAVNGRSTGTWASVMDKSVARIIAGGNLVYRVRDVSGNEQAIHMDVSGISIDDIAGGQLLKQLGITPRHMPVYSVVGKILPDSAAAAAGLAAGDEILSADGRDVHDWEDWVTYVRERPGQVIKLEILRQGQRMYLDITPRAHMDEGKTIGQVGIQVSLPETPDPEFLTTESWGPLEAIPLALEKTWDVAVMSLRVLAKMITGQASVKNLSGPISIAQYAGYTAAAGVAVYISFLAVVSVSLGLLNLFPIPLLDGGHLMYYLIEFVKGSPVSEAAQVVGQQFGLAVLLGLMTLVFYNDIVRLIG
ncbi:MAG: RIP metalloprotease RseP [Thiotrichales bacterium]|nr:RIP metalloprotease RseP [Thiotrichales bacterium]